MMSQRLFRGLGLKVVGLASKAAFVLIFAPQLLPGEFATYFVFSIYALIGSRLLSMGAEDVVSYAVRGLASRAGYYLSAGNLYGLVALVFLGLSFVVEEFNEIFLLSIAFSFVLAGTAFYIGALRSLSNAFQELRSNLPWLIVCACMVLLGGETAADIFRYLVVGYIFINGIDFFVVRKFGVDWGFPRCRGVVHHGRRWRRWVPVSLSSIGLAGSLRSFPIIMGWVGMPVTDSIAYNFLIGEVIYQVCMVYVNQIHSRISREKLHLSLIYTIRVLVAFVLCSAVAVVGVYVLSLLSESAVLRDLEYRLLFSVSLYCAAVASFSFVRVFAWKDRRAVAPLLVLAVQGVSFVLCGFLLLTMGMSWIAVSVSALLLVLLVYGLLYYLIFRRAV